MIAPSYTVDLGDRAVCHRNASFGTTEAVFLSTRLVEDRFGLAFEFFINVAHNFADAAGVPESFAQLIWSQAEAQVRGETSQDAWESRRRAQDSHNGQKDDRRAVADDILRVGVLGCAGDLHALARGRFRLSRSARARISAAGRPALAERLRHIASLFPPNAGYDFQILYRRKG